MKLRNQDFKALKFEQQFARYNLPGTRDGRGDEARRSRSKTRRGTKGKARAKNDWFKERHPERFPPESERRRRRRREIDEEDF